MIVEGVAQLMGQGHDVAEGAVKVGEHPALLSAGHAAVKGAAHLAVTGIEVDPCLVKGPLHHVVQLAVEAAEDIQQIILGVLGGILFVALAHGGEQLVPGQAVLVAQRLALGPQILPELRHVFVHGPQQGVQGFPLHAALVQGLVQGGGIAPDLALVDDLHLDAVQGEGYGILDLVIARQLRLIGALAHGGIGIVGQIADGGQVGDAAVVLHLHAAGQVVPQSLPRRSTGDVHPGEQLLLPVGEQVLAVPADGLQQEAIGLQGRVGVHDGVQVLQPCHRPAQGGIGGGAAAELGAEMVAQTVGLGIGGVGAAPKAAEDEELVGQLLHLLLHLQEAMHQLAVVHARRLTGQGVYCRDGLVQGCHVPGKGGVVKILIQNTQIPGIVHRFFLLFLFCGFLSSIISRFPGGHNRKMRLQLKYLNFWKAAASEARCAVGSPAGCPLPGDKSPARGFCGGCEPAHGPPPHQWPPWDSASGTGKSTGCFFRSSCPGGSVRR